MLTQFARGREVRSTGTAHGSTDAGGAVVSINERFAQANPRTMEWLRESRQCVHCHEQFQEMHNIGQWHCWYHPGALYWDSSVPGRVQRYSCCQRWARSIGCRAADHLDKSYEDGARVHYMRVVDGFTTLIDAPRAEAICDQPLPPVYEDLIRAEDSARGGAAYERWAGENSRIVRRVDNLLRAPDAL